MFLSKICNAKAEKLKDTETEFNINASSEYCSGNCLKNKYENMKKKAKKIECGT